MNSKNKLIAATSTVPDWDENEVWDNIESQLPERKKRRLFFILFFIAIGIMLSILIFKPEEEKINAFPTDHDDITLHTSDNNTYNNISQNTEKSILPSNSKSNLTFKVSKDNKTKTSGINNTPKVASQTQVNNPLTSDGHHKKGNVSPIIHREDMEPSKKLKTITILSIDNDLPMINIESDTPILEEKEVKSGFTSISYAHSLIKNNLQSTDGYLPHEKYKKAVKPFDIKEVEISHGRRVLDQFYLSLGINFRQVQHALNALDTQLITTRIWSDSAYVTNHVTPQYSGGYVDQVQVNIKDYQVYNKYNDISASLGIQYKKELGDFSLNLHATTYFTLLSTVKGYTFDENALIIPIQSEDISTKVGISDIKGKMNISYSIYRNIDIGLGLHYNWRLAPYYAISTTPDNLIRQSGDSYGAYILLRYNLYD